MRAIDGSQVVVERVASWVSLNNPRCFGLKSLIAKITLTTNQIRGLAIIHETSGMDLHS
jgi:hypothetical protein